MSRTRNALLVAAALGFGACSGAGRDGGANGETAESLTSYTQRLNAPWGNTDGKGHYQRIALKDDATYVALTAAGQERGSWSVTKPLIGAGKLTIVPTDPPGPSVVYSTSLSWFGGKLTLTSGKTKACYDTIADGLLRHRHRLQRPALRQADGELRQRPARRQHLRRRRHLRQQVRRRRPAAGQPAPRRWRVTAGRPAHVIRC